MGVYRNPLMFKMIVLPLCHGLSDFELEKQYIDQIYLRKFLGFLDYIPDNTTVCSSRKRIIDNAKKKK